MSSLIKLLNGILDGTSIWGGLFIAGIISLSLGVGLLIFWLKEKHPEVRKTQRNLWISILSLGILSITSAILLTMFCPLSLAPTN